ncbi:MAG: shikimate kinase, partial [Kofleriaceae bacterium]
MPPLFLIGFMAAGKTSVGKAIARASGRPFIDLDDAVAAMGESTASLVARDEAEFRRREAKALETLIAARENANAIVATGGGAAASGNNLDKMRAAGLVVALGVDVGEAEKRAQGGPLRPLLASAATLATSRAPTYRKAHAVVDTMGRAISEVAAAVTAVERAWLRLPAGQRDATVVALGDRSYPIIVGATVDLGVLREHLAGATKLAVITDTNVVKHAAVLAPLGAEVIEIPPGEASKSLAVFERLCQDLVSRGLDRHSAILALGGGVVGDLAGFVAASLFRGIPVIQLPTTIVAMTDSAIGGKTAVDLPAGKNLVGAFWQPRLVMCALATLSQLPARERRAGFGELWKYALLDG